jgi:hypothetical protein
MSTSHAILPSADGWVFFVNPCPGIGFDTSRFHQFVHKPVIVLEVLTLQGHLIAHFLLVWEEKFIVTLLNGNTYDVIDEDLGSAQGRIELVGICNLPVIPAVIHSALAGVDTPNVNLAVIMLGFNHGIRIPELRLRDKAALIMVLDPKDQSLNPLNVHRSENHSPGSAWP